MIVIDDLRREIGVMLHPSKEGGRLMTVGETVYFYLAISLVPAILSVIINWMTGGVGFPLVGWALVAFGLAFPLYLLAGSVICHLFGFFLKFKRGYGATLTALTYGIFPEMLSLPILAYLYYSPENSGLFGLALFLILSCLGLAWSFVVAALALAKQQEVSTTRAFGALYLASAIMFVLLLAFLWSFTGVYS